MFLLSKKKLIYFIVFLLAISSYILNSNIFLAPLLVLFFNFKKESIFLYFISFFGVFFIIFNGMYQSVQFLFYIYIIIYCSDFFKNDFKDAISFFSISVIIFLLLCLLFPQQYSDILSVISLKSRMWPIINGTAVNPNVIGMISLVACIYFFKERKYLFFTIGLYFIILSQSRASLGLLILACVLIREVKIKSLISLVFLGGFLYFFLENSILLDRIQNDGDNNRVYLFYSYWDMVSSSFPFSVNTNIYGNVVDKIGFLDNLYVKILFDYGVSGLLFLFIPIYFFIKYRVFKDRFKLILFSVFFILGFVESSYLNNAIMLIMFSSLLKSSDSKVIYK